MKTFKYLLLSVVLLTTVSCNKQNSAISINQQLIGKWQYVGLSGGIGGFVEHADPATVKILEFKAGNKFTRTTNSVITDEGDYDIIQEMSIVYQKNENAVRFNPQSNPDQKGFIITIRDNELLLDSNVPDGVMIGYKKL